MMRFTLAQLRRQQFADNTFESSADLRRYIDKSSDLIDVADVHFKGTFSIEADHFFHFDLEIMATLTVACAITLEPVEISVDIEVRETFTEDDTDEYRRIDGITIDLLPVIWSNIYLEKPMRVVKDGATFESDEPSDRTVNPAFEALKKYKR